MKYISLHRHKSYAVFSYKGSNNDSSIYEFIFKTWLPDSDYIPDDRPHFEVLGEKYKNNDPSSEEEIWIPVKLKQYHHEQKQKQMTVDDYISSFPENVQEMLRQIRMLIKENAPEAEESIAYRMPAYKKNGRPLVYFAGFKNHIGLYATPNGHARFKKELSGYKQGKGSVQFPTDRPLPSDLIARIIIFRSEEITAKHTKEY